MEIWRGQVLWQDIDIPISIPISIPNWKIEDSLYPYPYPVNAGIPHQNRDEFGQYPRKRVYLPYLIALYWTFISYSVTWMLFLFACAHSLGQQYHKKYLKKTKILAICMFFFSICVVVIFILFWICIRIRNVLILLRFVCRYFYIYRLRVFFCIYILGETEFFLQNY